ncbi:MAG: hypothetical protein L6R28_22700 [Planctomycetes bacterium]|nr:hypothetical protein [Planctomycetota bacterium]
MFDYRDFHPEVIQFDGWLTREHTAAFETAMKEANAWVEEHEVEVINIETVVLPNIHESDEEGSEDGSLWTGGESSSTWNQVLRVWFRT